LQSLTSSARRAFANSAARFPSELGLLALTLALGLTVAAAAWFAQGRLGVWSAALLVAAACALGRKVERDLRANAVYPTLPWLRHTMLALGWLMRPYDPNPWVRIELRALGLTPGRGRALTLVRLLERFAVLYGPPTWLYVGCWLWCTALFLSARHGVPSAGVEQVLPLAQLVSVVWLLPGLLQAVVLGAARIARMQKLASLWQL
jgi:hypothetical protein